MFRNITRIIYHIIISLQGHNLFVEELPIYYQGLYNVLHKRLIPSIKKTTQKFHILTFVSPFFKLVLPLRIYIVTPIHMALSAILNAGQWYTPMNRSIKSITYPRNILSIKFPHAPPMINEMAIVFCWVFKRNVTIAITRMDRKILVPSNGMPKFNIPKDTPKFLTRIRFMNLKMLIDWSKLHNATYFVI